MAAILHDPAIIVECICQQAIPLAIIIMRNSIQELPFPSYMGYGALLCDGAPLITQQYSFMTISMVKSWQCIEFSRKG